MKINDTIVHAAAKFTEAGIGHIHLFDVNGIRLLHTYEGQAEYDEAVAEFVEFLPAQPTAAHVPSEDGRSWVLRENAVEILFPVYESEVEAHLDAVAKEQGYNTIYTAISYIGSTDPKWNAEGIALRDWRDSVWLATHGILNDVVAEVRTLPTIEQVIAELPEYEHPEVV